MLDLGSSCPKCGIGTVVLVSTYRRAPDKPYSSENLAGPIPTAQTQFRCSTGCTWVEKDEGQPASRARVRRWRSAPPGKWAGGS